MPVKLKTSFEVGWKRNNASDKIFCVIFIDEKTGQELFRYAPKYSDIVFWKHMFKELIEYEFSKLEKLPGKLASSKSNMGCGKGKVDRTKSSGNHNANTYTGSEFCGS